MDSIAERLVRLKNASRMAVTRQGDAPPFAWPPVAGTPLTAPVSPTPVAAPTARVRRVAARLIALPHGPDAAFPTPDGSAPTAPSPAPRAADAVRYALPTQEAGVPAEWGRAEQAGPLWTPDVTAPPPTVAAPVLMAEEPADPFGDHAALLAAGLRDTPPPTLPPLSPALTPAPADLTPRPLRAASFMEALALNAAPDTDPRPDHVAPAEVAEPATTQGPVTLGAPAPDSPAPGRPPESPRPADSPGAPGRPTTRPDAPVAAPPSAEPVQAETQQSGPANTAPVPMDTVQTGPVQVDPGQTDPGRLVQAHSEPESRAAAPTAPPPPVQSASVPLDPPTGAGDASPAPRSAQEDPPEAPAPATPTESPAADLSPEAQRAAQARERQELEALLRGGNNDIPVRLPRRPRPVAPRAPAPAPEPEEVKVAPPIPADVSQNILARLNRFAELEAAGETDASVIPFRQLEQWEDHHPERNVSADPPVPAAATPGTPRLDAPPVNPASTRVKARSRGQGREPASPRGTPAEADEEPERGPATSTAHPAIPASVSPAPPAAPDPERRSGELLADLPAETPRRAPATRTGIADPSDERGVLPGSVSAPSPTQTAEPRGPTSEHPRPARAEAPDPDRSVRPDVPVPAGLLTDHPRPLTPPDPERSEFVPQFPLTSPPIRPASLPDPGLPPSPIRAAPHPDPAPDTQPTPGPVTPDAAEPRLSHATAQDLAAEPLTAPEPAWMARPAPVAPAPLDPAREAAPTAGQVAAGQTTVGPTTSDRTTAVQAARTTDAYPPAPTWPVPPAGRPHPSPGPQQAPDRTVDTSRPAPRPPGKGRVPATLQVPGDPLAPQTPTGPLWAPDAPQAGPAPEVHSAVRPLRPAQVAPSRMDESTPELSSASPREPVGGPRQPGGDVPTGLLSQGPDRPPTQGSAAPLRADQVAGLSDTPRPLDSAPAPVDDTPLGRPVASRALRPVEVSTPTAPPDQGRFAAPPPTPIRVPSEGPTARPVSFEAVRSFTPDAAGRPVIPQEAAPLGSAPITRPPLTAARVAVPAPAPVEGPGRPVTVTRPAARGADRAPAAALPAPLRPAVPSLQRSAEPTTDSPSLAGPLFPPAPAPQPPQNPQPAAPRQRETVPSEWTTLPGGLPAPLVSASAPATPSWFSPEDSRAASPPALRPAEFTAPAPQDLPLPAPTGRAAPGLGVPRPLLPPPDHAVGGPGTAPPFGWTSAAQELTPPVQPQGYPPRWTGQPAPTRPELQSAGPTGTPGAFPERPAAARTPWTAPVHPVDRPESGVPFTEPGAPGEVTGPSMTSARRPGEAPVQLDPEAPAVWPTAPSGDGRAVSMPVVNAGLPHRPERAWADQPTTGQFAPAAPQVWTDRGTERREVRPLPAPTERPGPAPAPWESPGPAAPTANRLPPAAVRPTPARPDVTELATSTPLVRSVARGDGAGQRATPGDQQRRPATDSPVQRAPGDGWMPARLRPGPDAARAQPTVPGPPRRSLPQRPAGPVSGPPAAADVVMNALNRALNADGHGVPFSPGEQSALRDVLGTSVADVRVVRRPEVHAALRAARADGLTVGDTVFLPPDLSLDRPADLALAAHEVTHARRAREPLFVPAAAPRSVSATDEEGVALATEHAVHHYRTGAPRAAGLPAPWEPMPGWAGAPTPVAAPVSLPVDAPLPSRPASRPEVVAAPPPVPAAPAPLWHAAATDRPAPAPAAPPKAAGRSPDEQAVGRRAAPRAGVDLDQVAREVYARLREQLSQEWRRLN
ncbi:eCIS core domain-containing protein [Deinococcus sedimenti]|uniref:eCIS core domain-containing protein n=1 Tax=Deinococcus sedimenti TaxID=1867090 RepID=A0ABQ2S3K9_9DEIO|nr:DUF4157 domain-containing protein [Deinococcus sedimenti]GGR92939.1 hypothetical protein GCM10008960_19920 [Deinococcus sedimenti]